MSTPKDFSNLSLDKVAVTFTIDGKPSTITYDFDYVGDMMRMYFLKSLFRHWPRPSWFPASNGDSVLGLPILLEAMEKGEAIPEEIIPSLEYLRINLTRSFDQPPETPYAVVRTLFMTWVAEAIRRDILKKNTVTSQDLPTATPEASTSSTLTTTPDSV